MLTYIKKCDKTAKKLDYDKQYCGHTYAILL